MGKIIDKEVEIIICPECEGIGQVPVRNSDGSPRILFGKPVYEVCGFCLGEHAVIRQATYKYGSLSAAVVEEQEKGGLFKFWKKK